MARRVLVVMCICEGRGRGGVFPHAARPPIRPRIIYDISTDIPAAQRRQTTTQHIVIISSSSGGSGDVCDTRVNCLCRSGIFGIKAWVIYNSPANDS